MARTGHRLAVLSHRAFGLRGGRKRSVRQNSARWFVSTHGFRRASRACVVPPVLGYSTECGNQLADIPAAPRTVSRRNPASRRSAGHS